MSAGIEDHEGVVVVNYYDNATKDKIKTQVVSGDIGKSYSLDELANTLNYDIKSSGGATRGEFTDKVQFADVYVEKFEGKMCNVTVRFIDDESEEELADAFVIRNREGKQYFTPELPSIEGYRLNMEALPSNGAGLTPSSDSEVIYKYTRLTEEDDAKACIVNAVYMADDGRIIEKSTVTGQVGEEYAVPDNEYQDLTLIQLPENFRGVFAEGEINVIFSYSSKPDPFAEALKYVIIGLGVIGVLCIASVFYSRHKRRERLRKNMDIIEKPENK